MAGPPAGGPAGPARVRTFKPRRRPLTRSRAELYDRLAPMWCLDETGGRLDPISEFGREAPLVLDIGIGLGEAFTTMAAADRGTDLVGVDVHTPGIAASLERIAELGLENARLVHGDALVFAERLAPGSLAGVRAFFPDPWPKARHRHRRLTSEGHVATLVGLLAPGGLLHVATDIDDYAAHTVRVCDAHPELVGGPIERPADRPVTRYERKGLAAGRTIVDLAYRRR